MEKNDGQKGQALEGQRRLDEIACTEGGRGCEGPCIIALLQTAAGSAMHVGPTGGGNACWLRRRGPWTKLRRSRTANGISTIAEWSACGYYAHRYLGDAGRLSKRSTAGHRKGEARTRIELPTAQRLAV